MSRRKLYWGGFGVLAVLLALTGLLDAPSRSYAEEAFSRSLLTFAVARTLNSVISVAQGTEVAVEPAGVGVNFALGEALDPINDLVERFSAVMLVATSSLALQNVLLRMTMWWGTSLALTVAAAVALLALWRPKWMSGVSEGLILRVLLICVFLRFAVPVFVIGTNLVFDTFLAAEQAEAAQALETTHREIEQITEDAAPSVAEEQSLVERLESVVDDSLQALDVQGRMERLSRRVSDATEHIIDLIVIFALQTIILPVVFLWLFAELLKKLATRAAAL
jgi:predicted membrane protein